MLLKASAASSTHASTTAKELSVGTALAFGVGRVTIFAILLLDKRVRDNAEDVPLAESRKIACRVARRT